MIPKECQLDIFIDQRTDGLELAVQAFLSSASKVAPLQFVGEGLALHYKNLMFAGHPRLVVDVKTALGRISGVYVNEYPPEILAEMAE